MTGALWLLAGVPTYDVLCIFAIGAIGRRRAGRAVSR